MKLCMSSELYVCLVVLWRTIGENSKYMSTHQIRIKAKIVKVRIKTSKLMKSLNQHGQVKKKPVIS
jgi:hypothetical protein